VKLFREGGAGGNGSAWRFMERFEVPNLDNPDETYLTRYRVLQTPWFGIYVHRFDGPDSRPTLHDHPWPFVSLVLWGGYRERRSYGPTDTRIRMLNLKRATDVHYIRVLDRTPTWTLMLVGRRQRVWGYVESDGTWTPYDEHLHAREFDAAMAARRS
jgi:hypothetical protein